ncbi:tRNA pseudouridine(38-40) synthase TruA [Desulfococcus multivorans]|uniref:tRNA pseudouridine synthase A n=1 Tax=Desulfococcus multivorans DSM 2059 TaxID=1121405 RepID=S7TPZ3_DESML|nr:tRNA pseudouridine(38-40) synthase TruA [Desulfococcus multivorans]AOY57948.1 TruA: tRNA pseudouridine synthase A [Desulfococcus multivorans]AQV00318.2 tRNA pseudouridine(38-40) synthase TruA [Desulfococcus multivorans]EPR39031.1 tRNA pseudouridine synthase A [Desulfococcus multivorans DSM 2059]SJZ64724.1 tRNA pseudouridine38-40 synthase [Desulfococcus multivorans DSM 2059]
MKNFRMTIEYDGGGFAGWQYQPRRRTVQGEIESALETMVGVPVRLAASGRTDAGVHALGQVAGFRCETRLSPEIIQKGLNSMLDGDIVIRDCREAPDGFHARFDAKGKTYHYHILNHALPSAIHRRHVWFIRRPLDTTAMQEAADHLLGEHDFSAFEGAGSPRSHSIRCITEANLMKSVEGIIVFQISANGFLRFMVRNIVGSLVDVGHRKTTPARFKKILDSRDRRCAGATAPPQGLFLMQVWYAGEEVQPSWRQKNHLPT